eukprot:scaffold5247_cov109-Ochromonas_danica.AAC.1
MEQSLQSMQSRAQKEEIPIPQHTKSVRTSRVDERYLLKDETENDIRAKIDRIGYNSRITPEELAQKKILTRPEQAEINAYNLRIKELGKDANANLAAEVPPTLDVPSSEEDWIELGDRYGMDELVHEKETYEREIEKLTGEIENLKRQGVKHGITQQSKKTDTKYGKTQGMMSTSIANAERDLRNYVISLRKANAAIRTVRELRRLYTIAQKQLFKEEMEAYMTQVSALTSYGLSTQRLPMESD